MNITCFIDGLLNQVKVREEALIEIREYLRDEIKLPSPEDDNYKAIKAIKDLFRKIHYILQKEDNELNCDKEEFKEHIKENLLISHKSFYCFHSEFHQDQVILNIE